MINTVFIDGNLTGDPELKYLPSSMAVCNFSLALNSKYKASNGEMKDEVSYIKVVAFGKTAENVAEYLSKGNKALVQGRLKQDRWEKDGKKYSDVKVMASIVKFMDGKNSGRKSQSEEVY